MSQRAYDLVKDARRMHDREGTDAVLRGAFRATRERLPVELWPELLLDPVHEADEVVSLHETPSFELRYDGRFPEELPRQLAAAEGRILGPVGAVYVYRDADVIGHRPVVGVDDGYLVPSWLGVDTAYFIHQEKYLRRNLPLTEAVRRSVSDPEPDRVVDTGFLLLGERGLEFPAWHHEVLPKLRWLEEYEERTGTSPTLVVPADVTSFRKRSLELLGYDPGSWVFQDARTTRVRELVVPPHPRRARGTHLHTTGDDLRWIADRMQSNLRGSRSAFPDRVFVSRADADRRHVRNEDEVVSMLRSYGFESYEPGRLGYEEEIELFAGADVVVGAHGKGLASVLHADDATLVELFPENGATEHYFLTARECGFEYEYLTCEPVYDGRNVRPRDRDFLVDVDALRDVVAEL